MYLTGYVQRDRLWQITNRWFSDQPLPQDGAFLTKLHIYESLINGPVSRQFLSDILRRVYGKPFYLERVYRKDDLREAIISGCHYPTDRMEALFRQYLDFPEEFFPRTPADLVLAVGEDATLLGMTRFKRVRRLAEKASRRVADHLAESIRSEARRLATIRAAAAGVRLEELISSADTMRREFAEAERVVSHTFRDGYVVMAPEDVAVDDAIGFKFVGSVRQLGAIEAEIAAHPGTRIVDRAVHTGDYNDISLLVDLDLPPADEIVSRVKTSDWAFARGRGLKPEDLAREFPEYVLGGSRSIQAEVVLTTYEELAEAEFGRSIHEERIVAQRRSAPYTGRIAANAAFLIEYMMMLAISPTIRIDSLPVKMWGRYLPDTFSRAVWQLFGIEHGGVLYDPFVLDSEELLSRREASGDDRASQRSSSR